MNTANDDSAPRSTLARWLTHHYIAVAVAFAVGTTTATALPDMAWPLALLLIFPQALWLFTVIYAEPVHGQSLCEWCISRAPLNPGAEAERLDGRLRFTHWFRGKPPVILPITVGVFLCVIFVGALLKVFVLTTSLLVVMSTWIHVLDRTHSRLQPWCKYCRHGRGDDDDPVPAPKPVPTGTVER